MRFLSPLTRVRMGTVRSAARVCGFPVSQGGMGHAHTAWESHDMSDRSPMTQWREAMYILLVPQSPDIGCVVPREGRGSQTFTKQDVGHWLAPGV